MGRERHRFAPYADAVLNTAPVAYLPLDEGAGTAARSLSGGTTGTYTAGYKLVQPGVVPTDAGAATALDGTDGQVALTDVTWFDGTASFSFAIWFRPTIIDATGRRLVSKFDAGTNGIDLLYSTAGFVFGRVSTATRTGLVPVVNTTYFVAVTYDGASVRLYVDAALQVGALADVASHTNSAFLLRIGQLGSNSVARYAAGRVAHAAFWTRAVSQAEVTSLHTIGRGG